MSVFTHHPFYTVPNSDYGNFGSLVRFIDDWEKHVSRQNARTPQQAQQSRHSRRTSPTFTPRFDVRETEQNYELHGELPGIEKKDITIEFNDIQTIVIRGNVERSYTEGDVPAGVLENTTMSGAIANEPHNEDLETSSNKSFRATVEDEEAGARAASTSAAAEEPSKPGQSEAQQKAKYWIYERSVGSFSRSFTFSGHVDHDNVKASLDNGILTVIVPKAKKPEVRRVAIH
ncbi:HSP20-like chaperone [Xylaria intraflava]|nr:HSP20-like chaperone [Xylaria intraflava]